MGANMKALVTAALFAGLSTSAALAQATQIHPDIGAMSQRIVDGLMPQIRKEAQIARMCSGIKFSFAHHTSYSTETQNLIDRVAGGNVNYCHKLRTSVNKDYTDLGTEMAAQAKKGCPQLNLQQTNTLSRWAEEYFQGKRIVSPYTVNIPSPLNLSNYKPEAHARLIAGQKRECDQLARALVAN